MCIVVISTSHPDYPIVLISNRDEFVSRPTAPASFWDPPYEHVLAGRDLLRAAHGTWLGVARDGRLAVLTNFHEPDPAAAAGRISRGEMVNAFLKPERSSAAAAADFAKSLINGASGARGAGGFSLVCGRVGGDFAVVSNRMADESEIKWIAASSKGETVALSNAAFGDHSWPKVTMGEQMLADVVAAARSEECSKEALIDRLFGVLSTDTMPAPKAGETKPERVFQHRKTIFIPLYGERAELAGLPEGHTNQLDGEPNPEQMAAATSGSYGTRQQTVVLVDRDHKVTYVERTLFDNSAGDQPKTRTFEFQIES